MKSNIGGNTNHIHIAALGTLPHTADKTMEVGGYTIPKGSIIVGMTMGIMYDPKVLIVLFINYKHSN